MPLDKHLPPSSNKYLIKLFHAVFKPARLGQHVNIITFTGGGKWANLNFLSDYYREIDPTYPKTIFLHLNARNLAYNIEEELDNAKLFLQSKALTQEPSLAEKISSTINTADFKTFITSTMQLTSQLGQRMIIFIDGAEFLTEKNRKAQLTVSNIASLAQLHIAKTTFVFLTKAEIDPDISHVNRLQTYLTQNIVTEADHPHTAEDVEAYIERFQKTRNVKFSKNAIKNLMEVTSGIPLISKELINKYHLREDIKKAFDKKDFNISDIFQNEAVATFIDNYFIRLLTKLSIKSKDYLFGMLEQAPKYLITANLIDINGEITNKIFKYFIQNRGTRFPISNGVQSLSPQENLVFQLLSDNLGKSVSREEIARTIWTDNWQDRYSEQAIDKLLSKLRAKLESDNYEVLSIKGVGVVLKKTEVL